MFGFLIFGTMMFVQLSYSLAAGRDKTLLNRAGRAEGVLERCRHDNVDTCAARFADFVAATPEGNLIRVFDSGGNQIYPLGATQADDFPWPQGPPITNQSFTKIRYAGGLYRVLSKSTQIGSDQVVILVGGQLKDNGVILQQFKIGLMWATPVFLGLCAFFGYFMGRRALRPVTRLATSARSLSLGNLTSRLPILNTGDEVQDLAETCNELLDRLEHAAKEIARFTADASHELRSPISYIYTLSESAIRNPTVDKESADAFGEIVCECSDATRLLDDMLTLARFDAGHADISFSRLNLAEVLLQSCDKARPFAEIKQHRMLVQVTERKPVWVMGDTSGLRRLFWILLDNAIKYTPASGSIDVALTTVGKDAVVSVKDTGIGIAEADLPDIFRRFYRVDKARILTEGTGLGLSIAKWISDIHGGELSVESVEYRGTTFQVSFRLAT